MRRATALSTLAAGMLAGFVLFVSPAAAEVPVEGFGLSPSTTQAGGHPDLQIAFVLRNGKVRQLEEGLNSSCDCENPRFITVHAPQGLVGSPRSLPTCTAAQFGSKSCPVDSQVGVIQFGVQLSPETSTGNISAVYNMVPREGEAGLLAFSAQGAPIFEIFSARTGGDYGLETKISIPSYAVPRYANQVLWGVPASPSHDALRFKVGTEGVGLGLLCDGNDVEATPGADHLAPPFSGPNSAIQPCSESPGNTFSSLGGHPNSPPIPFTENPTSCGVPLQSGFDVLAYDGTTTHADAPYPASTGCDQLSFNPSLAAKPTTNSADSPSGIDVNLTVPQYESPTVPSPSEIKATRMTLPPGFTINPNAADGKSACTNVAANIGTGSTDAARCPEAAKIGTLEIHTALLPGPLPGYLYLGEPLPGNRYRVFLVADGFDVHVKLPGTIVPDKATGQVSVIFDNLPETPFENFTLHIFGSERGSLATPTRCGTYPITTTFTPWDSVLGDQSSTQYFTVDQGPGGTPCPGATRPFRPGIAAGSAGNTAGAHSSFAVDLTRADGNQFLTGLAVTTPQGFSANLKGIPYCPQSAIDWLGNSLYSGLAEIAASACPAASQIGTVRAGAGAGSRPFYAPGKVYLAGPYRGAPLSLVVVVPAVSGPYDLGNVAARAAIEVSPTTARVTTVSDRLPQILEGIPLRTREVRVDIDRKRFALNPTNCKPFSVDATITGEEGGTASQSVPYQVANCALLPFGPKLVLKLSGGTTRTAHPALKATLRARPGEAGIKSSVVALPHSEFLDQGHIGTVCTRVQFAADQCPAASIYGHAKAVTPILDAPLQGPVYLRSSSHSIPDLVASLHGQVDFELSGRVDSVNGGIRTSFETVPDVPVTKFTLTIQGGAKGLLQNSRDICKKPGFAAVKMVGQNGKQANTRVELQSACGRAKKDKRPHLRARLRAGVR